MLTLARLSPLTLLHLLMICQSAVAPVKISSLHLLCVCVCAATCACEDAALWVDKHCPTTREDLVVHRKKVEEVAAWLEAMGEQHPAGSSRPGHGLLAKVAIVTGRHPLSG